MGSGGSEDCSRQEPVEIEKELPAETIEVGKVLPPQPTIERTKAWAGIVLSYITLGFIGLESLIMIVYFFCATYSLKSLGQPLTQESLQIFKEARSAVVDDVLKIGNLFLGSVLLPILTLLLGYIFGSRTKEVETGEGD
jgi:hypothetical protein